MPQNVFIDGSYNHEQRLVGIGIYNSSTKFELAGVAKGENVSDAELLALKACIKYCQKEKIVNDVRIFTDSQEIEQKFRNSVLQLGFLDLKWIPRELNKDADRLSVMYKTYSKTNKTTLKGLTIVSKVKEVTSLKSLNPKQIVSIFLNYSPDARFALIEKLSKDSKVNANVYKHLILGGPLFNVKKNTFYYFIQAILPEKFTPSERYYATSRLSEQGLVDILKPKG